MEITVTTTIPFPIDDVYLAMQDHLEELSEYMPNIENISVEKREEKGDGWIHVLNRWQTAPTEIPAVAKPFIDREQTYWFDHAKWHRPSYKCDWFLEMSFMPDRINCQGTTSFHQKSETVTEMRITGSLEINLKGMVPRILLRRASSGVEKFIGRLVQPNFQKTAEALTSYLRAQQ